MRSTMLNITRFGALVALLLGAHSATAAPGGQEVVLADRFDDGRLHPAWAVRELGDARPGGFAFVEGSAGLLVLDLEDPISATDRGGRWARVRLSRGFEAPLSDFDASFTLSWDELETNLTVQSLRVQVIGAAGGVLAEGGYLDGSVSTTGSELAEAGGSEFLSRGGRLATSGSARVVMSRVGQSVAVTFGGLELVRGAASDLATGLSIEFGHYAVQTPGGQRSSSFGVLGIEDLRVRGLTHCRADLNADGSHNIFDVLEFFELLEAGDRAADLARDGRFDVFDLVEFLERYARPC